MSCPAPRIVRFSTFQIVVHNAIIPPLWECPAFEIITCTTVEESITTMIPSQGVGIIDLLSGIWSFKVEIQSGQELVVLLHVLGSPFGIYIPIIICCFFSCTFSFIVNGFNHRLRHQRSALCEFQDETGNVLISILNDNLRHRDTSVCRFFHMFSASFCILHRIIERDNTVCT